MLGMRLDRIPVLLIVWKSEMFTRLPFSIHLLQRRSVIIAWPVWLPLRIRCSSHKRSSFTKLPGKLWNKLRRSTWYVMLDNSYCSRWITFWIILVCLAQNDLHFTHIQRLSIYNVYQEIVASTSLLKWCFDDVVVVNANYF